MFQHTDIRRIREDGEVINHRSPAGGHLAYDVDAARAGSPSPQTFQELAEASIRWGTLAQELDGPHAIQAAAIRERIDALQRDLARERLDDAEDRRLLCLGQLDVLPEVHGDRSTFEVGGRPGVRELLETYANE